ncbi:MAG: Mu transposase C-terminal domain-containing protein [Rhodospirillaceae bacterium]|nr:Mu transposase C-terminal domain-containing protein [Rhodospirillaceae bacterium]
MAELRLPGVPASERGVRKKAAAEGWATRERDGRGGGQVYHVSTLPTAAHVALMLKLSPPASAPATDARSELERDELWRWFEAQPETKKAKARERLEILDAVMALYQTGIQKDIAVVEVGRHRGIGASTIYSWLTLVAGRERADWLPALCPRHTGRTATIECHPDAWDMLKSDYLRNEAPNFSDVYGRVSRAAKAQGWAVPSERTLLRRLQASVAPAVIVLAREGTDAVKRMYPAQERDRSVFHALQAVNADGHRWDIWVEWPDGEVARPCMVGFQDLYSGKILSWRVDKTENSWCVRLAFGDLVEDFGIPELCWFDNGRNFASKWLTGGTPNRYRFTVRDDEPAGILTQLGVEIRWALPYSGQSKPIERAWRDFAQVISRHPAFAGAWTGNSPMDKPENYRSRAIKLDDFLRIVKSEINEHNARTGRQTRVCNGVSFDAAFTRSYIESPIRKATEEQRRLWLLAAEGISVSERDGTLRLMGNRYWADFLHLYRGEKIAARFDPDFLHDGLHVYRLDGAYLGHATVIEAAGFDNADAAREHGRQRKRFLRAQRDMLDAERRMSPAAVADLVPLNHGPLDTPAATVVQLPRPVHDLKRTPSQEVTPDQERRREALIAEFRRPDAPEAPRDEKAERYERAMRIELAIATNGDVGDGEVKWLEGYRTTAEYQAKQKMRGDFEQVIA